MKIRMTQFVALSSLAALLISCETVPSQSSNKITNSRRVNVPYTATCLHPKCSKPAPYSSRNQMVCDYHSNYKLTEGEISLLTAVKSKDHSSIRELLKTVDPNFLENNSGPPVYWAVIKNDLVALKLLEESGADLNWIKADGYSLVFDAAYNNFTHIAAYLKSKGVNADGEALGRFTRSFTNAGIEVLTNPSLSARQNTDDSNICYMCKQSPARSAISGLCSSCAGGYVYGN